MRNELGVRLADELLRAKNASPGLDHFLQSVPDLSHEEAGRVFYDLTGVMVSRWTIQRWREKYGC